MRRVLATAAILASLFVVGSAQQPPAPAPTFRSSTEIVSIDVSVFDDKRQPVRGLTAADFMVVENGKPLPIVAFKAIDLPDRHAYAAPWMRDIAPDVITNNMEAERVVVLLLDDFNVARQPEDMSKARTTARAIIDQLGPADAAAVVYTFNHENGQDFTSDRSRLYAAADRFISAGGVPEMACAHNECVTAAFRSIAQVLLEAWPGRRKTIAYVSPEGHYSLGPQNIEQNAFEANAAIWNSAPDLARTFRVLQEANVNVYQYDSRGLKESLDIINGGIGMFADATGGRTVTRTNSATERVTEMFVENSSYYMLGIQPIPGKAGQLHRIDVKVARADVDVRTRAGYYEPSESKATKASKTPPSILDKAMDGTLPKGELPMSFTVVPFASPGPAGAMVAIVAGLDRPASMSEKDVVEIAARAFDEGSAARRSKGVATGRLQLTRRPTATGNVHYDIATRLDVAPGRYEVRLAMDSQATRLNGSAFKSVVVPDFKKDALSMSGVVLGRLPFTPAKGKDPLGGLLPFTPTTIRTFSETDRIGALVRVHIGEKAPQEPVDVRTRIIDRTDRTVMEESTRLQPNLFLSTARTMEHTFELPLEQLETGEYLLSIEAKAGKLTQTRHVRFKVE